MTDVKLIVLEDGDTYGGAENSRIISLDENVADVLEDYEDFSDLPAEQYQEHGTIGEIERLTRRTLRAWYAMDKRTGADRGAGNPEVIEMDAAVYDLALALGIAPYDEHQDKPEVDERPTQCAGLSGECPNPPLENGLCEVHR